MPGGKRGSSTQFVFYQMLVVWQSNINSTKHVLSLPLFIPLAPSIVDGLSLISSSPKQHDTYSLMYTALPINLISQLSCVAGVNMLTSRLSSVSTNLILTSRKALSLCISIWWFGSPWNSGMTAGSVLVGLGTVAYTWSGSRTTAKSKSKLE